MVRILLGVAGFSGWLYLQLAFRALGDIHQTSSEGLTAAKSMNGNPWFRRFLRSWKPLLRVNVGEFYYVDKGMPLTLLIAIILERTVNLLIAEQLVIVLEAVTTFFGS